MLVADQTVLPLWPRQHDLPPRWDGMPVEWGNWTDTDDIFICPPPKPEKCEHCRSTRPPLMNLGRIWTDPATTPAIGGGRQIVANLAALRCPDCRRDHVLLLAHGEWQAWNLDETDYTDDGSWDVQGGNNA